MKLRFRIETVRNDRVSPSKVGYSVELNRIGLCDWKNVKIVLEPC